MEWLFIGISWLFTAIGSIIALLYWFKFRDFVENFDQMLFERINTWLSTPENQENLQKNVEALVVQPLKMAAIGQLGGITKGVSHQMKGLEADLLADGIGAATGNPMVGAAAAKYLQKYPVLQMFLPMILNQGNQGNRAGSSVLSPSGGPALLPNPTSSQGIPPMS